MTTVSGAGLYERRVAGDIPVVARAQAELHGWGIGARGVDRTERVGDHYATGAELVACVRDLLAKGRAGGIVVEQYRRIRLPAVVPGCRTLHREAGHDPG